MKSIGLFTSDAAVVVNVFFLLTFPLVGLAAYLVLRRLTVSVPVSIVCSILYTLMPYHFGGESCISCSPRTTSCRSGPTSCWRCSETGRCGRGRG